jgi:pyrroline-5-carboxylate reductase
MLRIGVVGVGTIGEALVRGLVAAHGDQARVLLSPRGQDRAQRLAAEFDEVTVMESNQAVLDGADWVVLALIPSLAQGIIQALAFRPDHQVVTLVADFDLARMRALTGPTAMLCRMVPLPFVEYRVGPLTVYPVTPELETVFGPLGDLMPASDERALDTMMAITSMMSAFYAVVGELVAWGRDHGLAPELSARYTTAFFEALLFKSQRLDAGELVEHWREMTPGGLNELTVGRLEQAGAITAWSEALDEVMARISRP